MPVLANFNNVLGGGVKSKQINYNMNGNNFYPYNLYNADKNEKSNGSVSLTNDSSCSTSACLFTSESVNYANVLVKNYKSDTVYSTSNKGGNNYLKTIKALSTFANTYLIANFSDMGSNVTYFALSTEGNGVITYNSADANTQPVTVVNSATFLFRTLNSVMYLKSSDPTKESPFCCVAIATPPNTSPTEQSSVLAFMRSTPNTKDPTQPYIWDTLNNGLIYSSYELEDGETIIGTPYIDYEDFYPDYNQYPIYVTVRKDDRIKILCCILDEDNDFFDVDKELTIYNKQFSIMTDFQLTSAMYLYHIEQYVAVFNTVIGGKLQWFKVICKSSGYNQYIINYDEPLEQIGDNNYICYMSNQGLYVSKNIPYLQEYTIDMYPEEIYSFLTHGFLNVSCINKNAPVYYPTGQTTFTYLLYNHLMVNDNTVWIPVKMGDIIRMAPNTTFYLIVMANTSFKRDGFKIKYDLYGNMIFVKPEIIKTGVDFVTYASPYMDYTIPLNYAPYNYILCCDKRNLYGIEEGEIV